MKLRHKNTVTFLTNLSQTARNAVMFLILTGMAIMGMSNAHAATDPTTGLMTDAASYFGFFSTNAITVIGFLLGIAVILGIGAFIISKLKGGHK